MYMHVYILIYIYIYPVCLFHPPLRPQAGNHHALKWRIAWVTMAQRVIKGLVLGNILFQWIALRKNLEETMVFSFYHQI